MDDRLRLRPTPEQYRAFGEYLCEAHSWYKHLPLMEGGRFVVFVAADAGHGRRVAVLNGDGPTTATGWSLMTPPEGPEFTESNPRLHDGWRTTQEYRFRFGHLDYSCWPTEGGAYDRDAGPAVRLPDDVVQRCRFVMYPYASWNFAEVVNWRGHAQALADLRAGAAQPARDEVLELARLVEALDPAWAALEEQERDEVLVRDREEAQPGAGERSDAVRRYRSIDERIREIMTSLREREVGKVREALAALDAWLREAEPRTVPGPSRL